MKRFVIAMSLAVTLFLGGAMPLWTERVNCPDMLTTQDREAITQVKATYRKAWLAGDAEGVRNLFTKDAVLMPHHGVPAVVGVKAINDFWWPAKSPKTVITKLEVPIEEISGDGRMALVRGRSEVAWTVEDQGKLTTFANSGTYLTALRKLPDGAWKITHHMWDDPPTQLVQTEPAKKQAVR
ncbi:MAG: YybH family protein [Terriglobales bacterium]